MSPIFRLNRAASRTRKMPRFLTLILLFALTFTVGGMSAWALPKPRDDDPGDPVSCLESKIEVSLEQQGLPLVGLDMSIMASTVKIVAMESEPGSGDCVGTMHALPAGRFQWTLIARPTGSSAALSQTGTLTATLRLDRAGDYRVQFTACPGGCSVPSSVGAGNVSVAAETRSVRITALDYLAYPPETEPILPILWPTSPSSFPDADYKCLQGGGVVDPQWVTVNPWHGPNDYTLLEGTVLDSHISRKDNFLNHDSQDFLTFVRPDNPYLYILKSGQNDVEVEWEREQFPEPYRATRGDRVSIFGYWIHDCGHEYKTEIHPPVLMAVHRPRAILLSAAYGTNAYVPGIVTDIWANQNAGETTRNCSDTGLHQPYDDFPLPYNPHCLPQTEGYQANPINRVYEFNIYLPRNPEVVVREAGIPVPQVPLYVAVQNPSGSAGPDPTFTVQTFGGGHQYLRVRLDLSAYGGVTYARRIIAGWALAAPDNWGLKRWKVRLNSLDVHDDGDGWTKGDGDWRFWANTTSIDQEWAKLFDCDGCVHGHEDFQGRPWETGAASPDRSLGSDLLLFPRQKIWVHTSGFEEDVIESDYTGHVSLLLAQEVAGSNARSVCQDSGFSYCCDYTLNYEILGGQAVGPAALSSSASYLYSRYQVSYGHVQGVQLLGPLDRAWNHLAQLVLPAGQSPVPLNSKGFFKYQGVEVNVITDITAEGFRSVLEVASKDKSKLLDSTLRHMREEVDAELLSQRAADFRWDLEVLRDSMQLDLWRQYFGDIPLNTPDRRMSFLPMVSSRRSAGP